MVTTTLYFIVIVQFSVVITTKDFIPRVQSTSVKLVDVPTNKIKNVVTNDNMHQWSTSNGGATYVSRIYNGDWIKSTINDNYYQFNIGDQSWIIAREICLARNSDLLVIGDRQELNWITKFYQPQFPLISTRTVLIGLIRNMSTYSNYFPFERNWIWIDGRTTFNRHLISWKYGEPFDVTGGLRRCGVLKIGQNIRIDDAYCDGTPRPGTLHRFVCERTPDQQRQSIEAGDKIMTTTTVATKIDNIASTTIEDSSGDAMDIQQVKPELIPINDDDMIEHDEYYKHKNVKEKISNLETIFNQIRIFPNVSMTPIYSSTTNTTTTPAPTTTITTTTKVTPVVVAIAEKTIKHTMDQLQNITEKLGIPLPITYRSLINFAEKHVDPTKQLHLTDTPSEDTIRKIWNRIEGMAEKMRMPLPFSYDSIMNVVKMSQMAQSLSQPPVDFYKTNETPIKAAIIAENNDPMQNGLKSITDGIEKVISTLKKKVGLR